MGKDWLIIVLFLSVSSTAWGQIQDNLGKTISIKERAEALLTQLYDPVLGAQIEYRSRAEEREDSTYLARYRRQWVYTQGIAIKHYLRSGRKRRAQAIAQSLMRSAVTVPVPGNQAIFGGWHFSSNTVEDTYKDPRLVTGANAWAMIGLGEYLQSNAFESLETSDQGAVRDFYFWGLTGLLHHQRKDGLITAGWTRSELQELQGQADYNALLGTLGYGDGRWAKAENVVTEHDLDMLALLNQAIPIARRSRRFDARALRMHRDRCAMRYSPSFMTIFQGRFAPGGSNCLFKKKSSVPMWRSTMRPGLPSP